THYLRKGEWSLLSLLKSRTAPRRETAQGTPCRQPAPLSPKQYRAWSCASSRSAAAGAPGSPRPVLDGHRTPSPALGPHDEKLQHASIVAGVAAKINAVRILARVTIASRYRLSVICQSTFAPDPRSVFSTRAPGPVGLRRTRPPFVHQVDRRRRRPLGRLCFSLLLENESKRTPLACCAREYAR